jgi:ubiquinone/menaquinone biosynthesis C-methylase UbiE
MDAASDFPAIFRDPITHEELRRAGDTLRSSRGEVARLIGGIWRFVDLDRHYARSFGLQWNHWADTLSDSRRLGHAKADLLASRTHFAEYDLRGKSLLECGMGGGDDTEVLLQLPLARLYSFDLSTSVERAKRQLHDRRLTLFQASILEIPVPDRSFDIVFCHRVLQHTPDPLQALRAILRKVAKDGLLFAHCYQRSRERMQDFKYKYRPLTKRLPPNWVLAFVERAGPALRWTSKRLDRLGRPGREFRRRWMPYKYYSIREGMTEDQLAEMSMLDTFDALTPTFDNPLTQEEFYGEIERSGFLIEHRQTGERAPLWCTARFRGD